MRLATYISFLIVILAGIATGWWLGQAVRRPAVDIEAAADVPEQGLPVYAQFLVTQSVLVPPETRLVGITAPVFVPKEGAPLVVALHQNGQELGEWMWEASPGSPGQLEIVFEEPVVLSGRADVQFSGRHISHDDKAKAPRLFVEKQDSNYPEGNYRIAQNEKEGDIGLALIEEVRRARVLGEAWRGAPLATTANWLFAGAAVLLLAGLPYVLLPKPGKYSD